MSNSDALEELLAREADLLRRIAELGRQIAELEIQGAAEASGRSQSPEPQSLAAAGSSVSAAGNSRAASEPAGGNGASAAAAVAADEDFVAPEWCIPIRTNVLKFEWDELAKACQFDVILMDPPWQLATHAPTRGVAIGYQQLPDVCIEALPIHKLQTNGFIFIWVINNKYTKALALMRRWGYRFVDDIAWVKQTVNRRMAKGHGYYLQHAKETCLVGVKGDDPPGCRHSVCSDVIYSERRGQSQKPEELYEMIEALVPNGTYLEIFGRKNNLRDYWVTIGNEL